MRRLISEDIRLALPLAAPVGALVLLLADIAARTLVAPQELATGAMTALVGAPVFIFIAARFLNEKRRPSRRLSAADLRPLAHSAAPCGGKSAAVALLVILLLALFSLTRGSFPMPSGTLFRALLGADNVGDQQRFILFDIRLPRLFMALLCGAMLGLAGAAMQSITRNGLADPGLIGVKEGASIVVLALVLFFPAVGLVWRPLAGMLGGVLVALLVLALARDCSRPRFILIGIGVSWTLAAAVGIFMTTADVRDVQTAMIWLAGSLHAATWPLLAVAFCWALPGALILF